ncbi:AAA-like domain-containing protein [Armatimonas rosea]|uniref:DNA-binding SARP family transcriptional activator n=1 Tax=Armatimonas rosea TaxID=685828 RepID=A0A7W9SR73_ARMRO|nr:AAA-like domain-containing protein [Armatimonas rosea]MBB6050738.1 DNA-binding SARP family transcriptional activator [Armatimonas rosea]
MISLTFFGPFEVCRDGKPVALALRRSDRLLAFLVAQNKPVAAPFVIENVWGDTGDATLRKAIAEVREALGEEIIRSQNQLLSLTQPISSDMERFDSLILASDPHQRREALALYTGPFLEGWDSPDDTWFQKEREKRKLLYLEQVRQQCQIAASRGDFVSASQLAFVATSIHPEYQQGWYDLLLAQEQRGEHVMARQSAERYHQYLTLKREKPDSRIQKLLAQLGHPKESREAAQVIAKGPMSLEDQHYIERPVDQSLQRALYEGQWTILIKGPRQTGKSSLLARGLNQHRQSGQLSIYTDLTLLDEEDLANAEQLCRHLASSLLLALKETGQLQDIWMSELPPAVMLTELLQDQLQFLSPGRLIWAIDGLDRVFGKPYQETFFAQLRSWHSLHALHPSPWSGLSLILVCSREPHLYIKDLHQSPFNIGVAIETEDFTYQESLHLYELSGASLLTREREALIDLLRGHPALLSRTFAVLARKQHSVAGLLEAPLESEIFRSHLHRLQALLEQQPALAAALMTTLAGQPCEERAFWELRSLGILQGRSSKQATFRCGLYRLMVRQSLEK